MVEHPRNRRRDPHQDDPRPQVDPQAAAVVARYGLIRATAPVRTPALPEAGMWARWCMPVRREGRLLGLLWVLDPDCTVGQADLPEIEGCADLAAEVMARTVRSTEHLHRIRDELVDRLLRAPDEEAARELGRAKRVPHDAQVQVDAPARRGGWALPGGMSAHVAGLNAPRAELDRCRSPEST